MKPTQSITTGEECYMTFSSQRDEHLYQSLLAIISEKVQEVYCAEKFIAKALQEYEESAFNPNLKSVLLLHAEQTETHAKLIEQSLGLFGQVPEERNCYAVKGIALEASDLIGQTAEESTPRDVAIIAAVGMLDYYRIANYECIITLAKSLGLEETVVLLSGILMEEKLTNEMLAQITSMISVV
jgi:ferritin-like metal-binding protein YciE